MVDALIADRVSIVRAFQRGDVVFVERDGFYSSEREESIHRFFGYIYEITGVRLFLLEPGMRIAAREEVAEKSGG